MKVLVVLFLTVIISACLLTSNNAIAINKDANKQLEAIIKAHEAFYLQSSPFHQAEVGESNARLPDLSAQSLLEKYQKRLAIYQELIKLDQRNLSLENQVNFSVLTYSLKNQLDHYTNNEHYMPLTAESGFHVSIADISKKVAFKTLADYQDYLARLAALPKYFAQQTNWMSIGLEVGISQPKVVLEGFEQSISAFIKEDVTTSSYYLPFKNMSAFISQQQKKQLQAQAKVVLTSKVMPAYQDYYDFMVNEYQPNARDNIAASSLPNGKEYYENRLIHYTTLPMTAEQVHSRGLAEVKRIRAEMDKVIKQVHFSGSFSEFVQFLRADKQFYATTPLALLKEASFIAKKMDAKLPSLFKTLPRTPYGVMAVPANIAPKYTTGRYAGSTRDDQPGNYWVNTYRLDRRPLYVLTALTLHEAVPGHHLQISLAKEMNNVAKFRNRTYISAFGEGWGLYAEYLGLESGMYDDPYHNFGRLTYEMWRACRLVVDTGMHTLGWSRAKAIDYLASNTALSLHNVKTEIDRYISWPGQALSYKIGELTIKQLRQEAEQALGDDFDLRDFHDQLLKRGSMPLTMLDKVIKKYIEQQKKRSR
jgi:uncharacterized protein (DUF885 family)